MNAILPEATAVRPRTSRPPAPTCGWRAAALSLLLAAVLPHAASAGETGVVRGRVRFEGPPPAPSTVYMTLDPFCDRQFPNGRPSSAVVVDPSGGLADAIVFVRSGLPENLRWPVPADITVLDQKGCVFVPHVLAVRVGQEIEIRNSDATFHNIEERTGANPAFRAAMPEQGSAVRRSFASPEVAVKLRCEAHPWMSAYIGVFDHPFFAVTGADGRFALPELPEGDYTIEAWHETLGRRSARVTVEEGETATIEFSFAGN